MACDGGHCRGGIQKHGLDDRCVKSLEMSETAQGEEDGADANRLASSYQQTRQDVPEEGFGVRENAGCCPRCGFLLLP